MLPFTPRRASAVIAAATLCAFAPATTAADRGSTGAERPQSASAACTGPQVRNVVRAFVVAFNRGSKLELDALWAREAFRWYSVSRNTSEHYVAYGRGKMLRYFAARHLRSERLTLTSFRFNGVGSGYGHFQYTLTRRATDIARGARERYVGKGAAACTALGPRLAVWSMGRGTPRTTG